MYIAYLILALIKKKTVRKQCNICLWGEGMFNNLTNFTTKICWLQ